MTEYTIAGRHGRLLTPAGATLARTLWDDLSLSIADIADRVGMSSSGMWEYAKRANWPSREGIEERRISAQNPSTKRHDETPRPLLSDAEIAKRYAGRRYEDDPRTSPDAVVIVHMRVTPASIRSLMGCSAEMCAV